MISRYRKLGLPNASLLLILSVLMTAAIALAQQSDPAGQLQRYHIKPDQLPAPSQGRMSPPRAVPRPADAPFITPPGFEVSTFAEGDFQMPRWMALAPNGDVFLADSRAGRVLILRDTNRDGKADEQFVFAEGLNLPFGIAFWKDYIYIGNTDAVLRFKYKPGQTRAEGEPEKVADLPGKDTRQHWTRNIIFNPRGTKMYVAVGSETNVSVEADPRRAAISEYNPDGSGHRIYASGLRNPVGLAFHPQTGILWTTVNERDMLGNDLVPDYLTSVQEGGFYGWPYSYIGKNVDPRREKDLKPELVARALVPDVLIQSHSAALGLIFYRGSMFPAEYKGDALVALHGSWNRDPRTGYKIIRVRFKNGKPVGGYEDFIKGWLRDENAKEVWGRPVGLLELPDGSVLITDDGAKKIWRVTYRASRRRP